MKRLLILATLLLPLALGCSSEQMAGVKETSKGIANVTVDTTKTIIGKFRREPVKATPDRRMEYAAQQDAAIRQAIATYPETHQAGDLIIAIGYPFLHRDDLPAALLHLCGRKIGMATADLVRLQLTNKGTSDVELTLSAELKGFGDAGTRKVMLPASSVREFGVSPAFKGLDELAKPAASAIRVAVARGDETVYEKQRAVNVHPRDVVFLDEPLWPFLAATVTPREKPVGDLVALAARRAPGRSFRAYQNSPRKVFREIEVIYDAVKAVGGTYYPNATSFVGGGPVGPQKLTLPAESARGTGANCIDGALLFASAFEAAGLNPYLVLVPRRTLVAVALDPVGQDMVVLDPASMRAWPMKKAAEDGRNALAQHAAEARMIDVAACRRKGIVASTAAVGMGGIAQEQLVARPTPPRPTPPQPTPAKPTPAVPEPQPPKDTTPALKPAFIPTEPTTPAKQFSPTDPRRFLVVHNRTKSTLWVYVDLFTQSGQGFQWYRWGTDGHYFTVKPGQRMRLQRGPYVLEGTTAAIWARTHDGRQTWPKRMVEVGGMGEKVSGEQVVAFPTE